jgi:hypothetical protein
MVQRGFLAEEEEDGAAFRLPPAPPRVTDF